MRVLRKLQLTGGSTLIVSLPKDWAKMVGIGRGDYVEMVVEPDGSLRLVPRGRSARAEELRALVEVGDVLPEVVEREVMSRYIAGYKSIVVVFRRPVRELRRAVKEVVSRKLIGAEIVEEEADRVTIQVLVNTHELPVTTVAQRMARVAYSMIHDSAEAFREANEAVLRDVVERDDIVDKFYLYAVRQLNAVARGFHRPGDVGLGSLREVLDYRMVVKTVERIGDHAQRMALNLLELVSSGALVSDELTMRIVEYSWAALDVFGRAMRALARRERATSHELIREARELVARHEPALITSLLALPLRVGEFLQLRLVVDSLRRIAEYTTDLCEVVLDMNA